MAPKRVLVVDDEPLLRRMMCIALTRAGYEVMAASDGIEALEKVSQRAFDAIFLDVLMPRKEGLQALVELRKQSDAFIIVMSGGGHLTAMNYLQAARACGAPMTLRKPFRMADMVSILHKAFSEADIAARLGAA